MQKPLLIRQLQVANMAAMRAVKAALDKYGNNHIVTTTCQMEQKELADFIYKLQDERVSFELKTAPPPKA